MQWIRSFSYGQLIQLGVVLSLRASIYRAGFPLDATQRRITGSATQRASRPAGNVLQTWKSEDVASESEYIDGRWSISAKLCFASFLFEIQPQICLHSVLFVGDDRGRLLRPSGGASGFHVISQFAPRPQLPVQRAVRFAQNCTAGCGHGDRTEGGIALQDLLDTYLCLQLHCANVHCAKYKQHSTTAQLRTIQRNRGELC